jgi:hypothetical protein
LKINPFNFPQRGRPGLFEKKNEEKSKKLKILKIIPSMKKISFSIFLPLYSSRSLSLFLSLTLPPFLPP